MLSPDNYVDAATNNAVAIIADSTRKNARNQAAYGMTTHTSIAALLLGPRYNGYVKEQCERPPRVEGAVDNGQQSPPVDQNANTLSSPASVDQPDAPPRTAIVERKSVAQQVAPLTSGPGSDQQMAAVIPKQKEAVAAAEANAVTAERNNVRLYGRRAAQVLSEGRRDVALASSDAKRSVYQEVVRSISQAVADQWLPKTVMADWLMDIARAHGSFGLNSDQLQQLISDAAIVIPVSKKSPASAPFEAPLDHAPR